MKIDFNASNELTRNIPKGTVPWIFLEKQAIKQIKVSKPREKVLFLWVAVDGRWGNWIYQAIKTIVCLALIHVCIDSFGISDIYFFLCTETTFPWIYVSSRIRKRHRNGFVAVYQAVRLLLSFVFPTQTIIRIELKPSYIYNCWLDLLQYIPNFRMIVGY